MLKYNCLALDHDDTMVQSEKTINYPCFCEFLKIYRPGIRYTLEEYVADCSKMTFFNMCKNRFHMTEEELQQEHLFWKTYVKQHLPAPIPGMTELLGKYRAAGGKICVLSMSTEENIRRDYQILYGMEPDLIFSCELPDHQRKPNTYALEQIQQQFGIAAGDILVVDDMKFGADMARNAGCPVAFAAWCRMDFPNILEEMGSACDFTFYSAAELEKFLFK